MLRAAIAYGVLAFAAGFVFGAIREIILIPRFGEAPGHWLEFVPLTCVIILIGIWTMRKWPVSQFGDALVRGVLSVGVLLMLESTFALVFLKIPVEDYLDSFNLLEGNLFPAWPFYHGHDAGSLFVLHWKR